MTVLIIAGVTLAVATTIAMSGINEMFQGDDAYKSQRVLEIADGCAEEAYFRLKKNSSYSGGTIPYDGVNCTVTIGGAGATRTITSSATLDDFTRTISSDVTFTSNIAGNTEGIDLTEWSE